MRRIDTRAFNAAQDNQLSVQALTSRAENMDALNTFGEQMMRAQELLRRERDAAQRQIANADSVSSIANNIAKTLRILPNTAGLASSVDALQASVYTPLERHRAAVKKADAAWGELSKRALSVAETMGPDAALAVLRPVAGGSDPRITDLINEVKTVERGPGSGEAQALRRVISDPATPKNQKLAAQAALKNATTSGLEGALSEYNAAYAARTGAAPAPIMPAAEAAMSNAVRALIGTGTAIPKAGAYLTGMVLGLAFGEPGKRAEAMDKYTPFKQWFENVDTALTMLLPHDTARDRDFVQQLATGAGSLVGFYLTGAAGLPVWVAGAAVEATATYEDAASYNAAAGERFVAFLLGAGLGTTEAIPVDRVFSMWARDVGYSRFTALLVNTRSATLTEFTQEFVQTMGEDFAAKYGLGWMFAPGGYDPERILDPQTWLDAGLVGGITGAAAGATATAAAPSARFGVNVSDQTLAQIGEAVKAEIERQRATADGIIADMEKAVAAGGKNAPTAEALAAAKQEADASAAQLDAQVGKIISAAAEAAASGKPPAQLAGGPREQQNITWATNRQAKVDKGTYKPVLKNDRVVLQPPSPDLPVVVLGEQTRDDWTSRIETTLTPEEIAAASNWYDDVIAVFEARTGDKGLAAVLAAAWLSANQNVSVAGAMKNVLSQAEQFAKGVSLADMKGGGLPSATAAARDVLQGQPVEGGIGVKISDFIDSAGGAKVRSWFGGKVGGKPFVIDVHSGRDLGAADPVYLNHLRRLGYDIPEGVVMDVKAAPDGRLSSIPRTLYEDRADRGRKLTDELNAAKWQGRSDWEPRQVQAVGWMSMLKLTRDAADSTVDAWEKNRFDLSFEVAGGEGSLAQQVFGERFNKLTPAMQAQVTQQVTEAVWSAVHSVLPTVAVTPLTHGMGAWMHFQNASAVGGIYGASWENAKAAANAIGWLLGQEEVWAIKVGGFTSAGATDMAIEIAGPRGTRRDELNGMLQALSEAGPTYEENGEQVPYIQGYSPILTADGREAIRIIVRGQGESAAAKRRAIQSVRDFMATSEASAAVDGVKANADVELYAAELYVASGDWTAADPYRKGKNYETQYARETQRRLTDDFRDARTTIQVETALAVARATGGERADEERASSREAALAQYAGLQPATGRDGRITLTHWSDEQRDAIDPARAGSGPLNGPERRTGAKWSFFGLDIGAEGGYKKEPLGDIRHEVELNPGELYNIEEDRLGLHDLTDPSMPPNVRYAAVVRLAKATGYTGVWNPVHPGGRQAVLFYPAKVTKAVNDKTGEVLTPPEGFDAAMGDTAVQGTGTSTARAPFTDEPTRPAEGVPTTDANALADEQSLREIAQRFLKLIGLTARQGRFTLRGADIMGQFSRATGVARLRHWDDVSTLFHEAGHAIHDRMDGELRPINTQHRDELRNAALKLYAGFATGFGKASDQKIMREGFAEAFRLFVQNRARARELLPGWTRDIEIMFDRFNPQLSKGLESIGLMMDAYVKQPSLKRVRSMVSSGLRTTATDRLLESLRENGFRNTSMAYFDAALTDYVDRFMPLRMLTARLLNTSEENGLLIDLKVADDPGKLAQLMRNAGARGMMQVLNGITEFQGNDFTTGGLQDAFYLSQGVEQGKEIGKIDREVEKDFATYLIALRALDEYRLGRIDRAPVNTSKGELEVAIKELEDRYGNRFTDAAKIMDEYTRALWKKMYMAGLIDVSAFEEGMKREFYVPLLRDMQDKHGPVGAALGGLRGANGSSVVKRFRGSDRNIIDPMVSLIQMTISVEETIWRNETSKALANLAERAGTAGAFVESIPAKDMIKRSVGLSEVAKQLTGLHDIEDVDAAMLMSILQPYMDQDTMLSYFRAENANTGTEPIVFYFDKGKVKAIQINDQEVANDVVELLQGVSHEQIGPIAGFLSTTSRVFRVSITSWPDFIMVNWVRDQVSAWMSTDVGFVPFVSGVGGAYDEVTQSAWAKRYVLSGGIMGGAGLATYDQARIDKDISALKGRGYRTRTFSGGAKGALKGLLRVTEVSETATRLGLFKAAYKRAAKDGLNDWQASLEAAYIATDYMDFGLHGDNTLLVRRTVPFLSAQINGLYKFMRTLGNTEVARRKGLVFALGAYFKSANDLELTRAEKAAVRTGRKAWIKMTAVGLLSALLAYLQKDDPDYQEVSDYLKTTGWVFTLGNGDVVYIPKPFEWGVVANIMESGIQMANGDKTAAERMVEGIGRMMGLPTMPPLVQTAIELRANYSFFQDRPIIPSYMQAQGNADASLAVNAYTSALAKGIGSITGLKPVQIDYFLRNMGASAARDSIFLYEQAANRNAPGATATDTPMLRRFIRDTSRGSTATRAFWNLMGATDGALTSAYRAYDVLVNAGNDDATAQVMDRFTDEQKAYALLNEHFPASMKRLHPMRRVRDINAVIGAMRREMRANGVTQIARPGSTTPYVLTAKQRGLLDKELQDYATREARNGLIFMGVDGWGHRKPVDLRLSLDAIDAVSPALALELRVRLQKAKVYSEAAVAYAWPEVRARLLEDGEKAQLSAILAQARTR